MTACHNEGKDILGFEVECEALQEGKLTVEISFPYGSPEITASDFTCPEKHQTEKIREAAGRLLLKRTLDRDTFYVEIEAEEAALELFPEEHRVVITAKGGKLDFSVAFGKTAGKAQAVSAEEVLKASGEGWKNYWEKGGIIRLNQSKDKRAMELERRIILSQYLMAALVEPQRFAGQKLKMVQRAPAGGRGKCGKKRLQGSQMAENDCHRRH